MGDALRSEHITVEVRYALTLPTNGTEVSKTLSWAAKDYATHNDADWDDLTDDALTVNSDGEQMVISWVKK